VYDYKIARYLPIDVFSLAILLFFGFISLGIISSITGIEIKKRTNKKGKTAIKQKEAPLTMELLEDIFSTKRKNNK